MTSQKMTPPDIREAFSQWCKPKRGTSNPEIMTNAVWGEFVKSGITPYESHKKFGHGDKQSPGWTFERYGKSITKCPNGDLVFIGGEHEDHYDEDFYIYNDVIVQSPDGNVSIYGYPRHIFPPTDSHSATLVGDEIYIVGRIGYPEDRNVSGTPVFILDLKTFAIRSMVTSGTVPRWLYKQSAKLSVQENAIIFDGGVVAHGQVNECVENLSTWRLCLSSGRWDRLAVKNWMRWRLVRRDGQANRLYKIGSVIRSELSRRVHKYDASHRDDLLEKGYPLDAQDFFCRHSPPIKHKDVPCEKYRQYKIEIDGIIVRYDEGSYDITVTVEGALPEKTITALKSHGIDTYSKLESTEYTITEL